MKTGEVGYGVGCVLFGDYKLFDWRGQHDADRGFEGTDHALVANRLQWLLDNSEVAA